MAWKAFDWLLQRLDYLGKDVDYKFSHAIVIGDETALQRTLYRSQGDTQAGLKGYTDLPRVVNNVCFGSSLYNPCLQIADWVALAVRGWAESRPTGSQRLGQLLRSFRGYPDNVLGRGIVPIPDRSICPPIPVLEE